MSIHDHGMVHDDVKSNNICVMRSPHGVDVTIIDRIVQEGG